jgi:hypothetical protein
MRPQPGGGGGRGIRTPDTLSGIAVFKTACFNRSHIPPLEQNDLPISAYRTVAALGISISCTLLYIPYLTSFWSQWPTGVWGVTIPRSRRSSNQVGEIRHRAC